MVSQTEKIRLLQELDEAGFRVEVLIPLLRKMSFKNVVERHGPAEYGKDITFHDTSSLAVTYYAVVAKIGAISGAASGKENLATIRNQIGMAFDMPIDDLETKQRHRVNRVVVWTSGRISNSAQQQVLNSTTDKYGNVEFKDGQATLALLEEHFPAFFTIRDPYVSDYYAAVKETCSRLEELRALGSSGDQHRLHHIFVAPKFEDFQNRRSSRPAKQQNARVIEPSQEYSLEDILRLTNNLILVGDGGSGKTTLLRRILLRTIEDNEQALRRSPIPIGIDLKKIDWEQAEPITAALNGEFRRFSSPEAASELNLDPDLEAGSVLALLDELDELKTEERVKLAIRGIKAFSLKHPKIRIVATSRLLDFIENADLLANLAGFRIFKIKLLTPEQMAMFVQNWYGQENQIGQRLIHLINQPSALRALPATPLTLALVAIIFESGTKEMPANLTELFQKYVELALGRWDVTKDLSLQYEWKIKEFVLRKISWEMHQQRKSEMACKDLQILVDHLAQERSLNLDATAFCQELLDRSELLILNLDSDFEFKHRSFQDYFAGVELHNRTDAATYAADKIPDLWWSQAIFFASGLRPDSDDYLDAIISRTYGEEATSFFLGINLGMLTQATYLASRQTKQRAVYRVLEAFTRAWNDFCDRWQSAGNEDADDNLSSTIPSHLLSIGFFGVFAQAALGSITLAPTLDEMIEQMVSETSSISANSSREWCAFLLSMACAGADNVGGFVPLFKSRVIRDPQFMLWGSFVAREISRHTWISPGDQDRISDLADELERKSRGQKKYLRTLLKNSPMRLPPPVG